MKKPKLQLFRLAARMMIACDTEEFHLAKFKTYERAAFSQLMQGRIQRIGFKDRHHFYYRWKNFEKEKWLIEELKWLQEKGIY